MGQLFSGRFLTCHIRPDRSPLDVNGMAPPATDASPQGHQAGQLRLRSGIGRHHCNLRCYVYRAVDEHGQIIDVYVSTKRDAEAARRFFHRALTTLKVTPSEVVTDKLPVCPRVLDDLLLAAGHHVEQHENNRIEGDHGRLKHRLRPHCSSDHRRARVHAKSPPRPLRNCHRNPTRATSRRCVHRTRPSDLTDGSVECPPAQ
jgi:IS1 family transposase